MPTPRSARFALSLKRPRSRISSRAWRDLRQRVVRDQVLDKLSFAFEDLGSQQI